MNARHLMAYLTLQGFVLSAADDDLVVHPASKLSDADRRSIRDRKTALLALLADQAGAAAAVAMVEPFFPSARLLAVRPLRSPEPLPVITDHRPPEELKLRARIEATLAEGQVGERVLDAMRRGREADEGEGVDISAPAAAQDLEATDGRQGSDSYLSRTWCQAAARATREKTAVNLKKLGVLSTCPVPRIGPLK